MRHPQQADIFLIPLINGDFGLGQVAEIKDTPDGTALCLFTLLKSAPDWPPSPIHYSEAISLLLVDTRSLRDGTWDIVGFEAVPALDRVFDLDDARAANFANLKQHEPAIIEAFLNACHGLYPWDGFPDSKFFNRLLINPSKTPSSAKMKSQFPQ